MSESRFAQRVQKYLKQKYGKDIIFCSFDVGVSVGAPDRMVIIPSKKVLLFLEYKKESTTYGTTKAQDYVLSELKTVREIRATCLDKSTNWKNTLNNLKI